MQRSSSPRLPRNGSFLTAQKKDLTYDRLRVWVEKSNYHPLRAEFLTEAGKPLKTAQYSGYKNIAGKVRPTEIGHSRLGSPERALDDRNSRNDRPKCTVVDV